MDKNRKHISQKNDFSLLFQNDRKTAVRCDAPRFFCFLSSVFCTLYSAKLPAFNNNAAASRFADKFRAGFKAGFFH